MVTHTKVRGNMDGLKVGVCIRRKAKRPSQSTQVMWFTKDFGLMANSMEMLWFMALTTSFTLASSRMTIQKAVEKSSTLMKRHVIQKLGRKLEIFISMLENSKWARKKAGVDAYIATETIMLVSMLITYQKAKDRWDIHLKKTFEPIIKENGKRDYTTTPKENYYSKMELSILVYLKMENGKDK